MIPLKEVEWMRGTEILELWRQARSTVDHLDHRMD
mgnify:CR=1 FL=1